MLFRGDKQTYKIQKVGQSKVGNQATAKKLEMLLSGGNKTCPYVVSNQLLLPQNFYLKNYSSNLIVNAWDVHGILVTPVPNCSSGGFYAFGDWSKKDKNWSKIESMVEKGELLVSDSSLNIYFKPKI